MAFQTGALPRLARECRRPASGRDPRVQPPADVARVLDHGGADTRLVGVADQLLHAWKVILADSWEPVRRF